MTVDRTGWGAGPWDREPDRLEWRYKGLACIMVRNPVGHWCGYVGLPPEHPFYGDDYSAHYDVNVHGGLTYSGASTERVYHVPTDDEPENLWWLGFDCAHLADFVPYMGARDFYNQGTYRDEQYVVGEVDTLARQLANARDEF